MLAETSSLSDRHNGQHAGGACGESRAPPVVISGVAVTIGPRGFLHPPQCRSSLEDRAVVTARRGASMPHMTHLARECSLLLVGFVVGATVASGQVAPYNPYADAQDAAPAIAADGTIHWGTFYKSAKLQQAYERLWNLGACRGSNKAITVPVAENKLVIDRLPEAEFKGIVRAVTGQTAGGMVAFDAPSSTAAAHAEPLVAQFHPAGVTRFQVVGQAAASVLAPGMVVRLRSEVDAKGRGVSPVSAFEIVSPPAGFVPDAVRADRVDTIVGSVVSIRKNAVTLRVDAGKLRRITLELDDHAVATIDAARLDLVAAGDSIEVKGRLWTGEGAMGAGTIFVSDVIVSKRPPVDAAAGQPGPRTVGAR